MAPPEVTARLRYLRDAGTSTSHSLPSTSAFLESSHDQVTMVGGVHQPWTRRREACAYCGSLFALDANPQLSDGDAQKSTKASQRRARAKKLLNGGTVSSSAGAGADVMTFECPRCRHTSRVEEPTSRSKAMLKPKGSDTARSQVGTAISHASTMYYANSSHTDQSQLSQKGPSKKQGRQAMLTQTRKSRPPLGQPDLNLMDFMKND